MSVPDRRPRQGSGPPRITTLLPFVAILVLIILGVAVYRVYVDIQSLRSEVRQAFAHHQGAVAERAAGKVAEQLAVIGRAVEAEVKDLEQPGGVRRRLVSSQAAPPSLASLGIVLLSVVPDRSVASSLSGRGDSTASQIDSASILPVTRPDGGIGYVLAAPLNGEAFAGVDYGNGLAVAALNETAVIRAALEGFTCAEDYSVVVTGVGFETVFRGYVAGQGGRTVEDDESSPSGPFDSELLATFLDSSAAVLSRGRAVTVSGTSDGDLDYSVAMASVASPLFSLASAWQVVVIAPLSGPPFSIDKMRRRHMVVGGLAFLSMLGFAALIIIQQVRSSRALRVRVTEQEEYLSAILQNSVDAIILIDNENRVRVWNHGAELIFGYRAEEMLGQSFNRLVPPDMGTDEELNKIRNEVYTKGHIRNYETQRLTKTGRRITVNISRTLIRHQNGEPVGSAAIIKDISDKQELDKKIYNTEKLASIGILAAGVAHEINNPLAVILGFTDLLKERFPAGTPEHEDLKSIEENANHAKEIVDHLLGFARVTEGRQEYFEVAGTLEKVVHMIQRTLISDRIALLTDIRDNLPTARGDSREFQQVIFNLANNSAAAMENTGGHLSISAWADGAWIYVQVKDTGHGIPERIRAQVFDPFFTTKEVGRGTGLGLSLCYGIVQKYGGRIEFSSTAKEDHPDRPSGTTFTVSMPVYAETSGVEGEVK